MLRGGRFADSINKNYLERLFREEEAAQKQLDTFTRIADSAVRIDSSLTGASAALEKVQGFSMSPEATAAMNELERAVQGFDAAAKAAGKTAEETTTSAEKTGGTMEIAFTGSAKAAELAGNKMARINAILEEMRGKANSAAEAIRNIPPMPNVGGGQSGGSFNVMSFEKMFEKSERSE